LSGGFVFAVGKAAPKVTGDIWFVRETPGVWRHLWFDAQEAIADRPVKGEFHQVDGFGNYYDGHVIAVDAHYPYGDFAVYIDNSNAVSPGTVFYIRVFDGGEPGVGVDWLDGGLNPNYNSYDNSAWPIYEGNIQVHT
jgi:hypothetical protein